MPPTKTKRPRRNDPAAREAAWAKIEVAARLYPPDAVISRLAWIQTITKESRSTIYRAAKALGFEVATPKMPTASLDEVIAADLADGLSLRAAAVRHSVSYYHARKVRDELL